ncbi:MAG: 50S ribosomal protein L30 [Deltaproteobacteria bacterium]|nr:50S ribosomal protein L30 [Deltaproteobacteria bacterium]
MQKIKVTQTGSVIARPDAQRKILRALGLRGIGQSRVHRDNNCIRGMVNKVRHLIRYELISD